MSKKHRPYSSHKKNDFASLVKAFRKAQKDPKYSYSVSRESAVDYLYNQFNNFNKERKNK